ncbi:MAG: glycosyltransferase family 4 protein [Actinomycetota bacterium]|nr:glycosyltransferase family 4 protein [Actinomycetota bacterium]
MAAKALRIAVVAPPWFEVPPAGYGGIESVCFDLVEGLVDIGHDVTLVAAGSSRTRAHFVQALREPAAGLGTPLAPVQEVRWAALANRALADAATEHDVVHDHTLAGPLLASGRAVPTVMTAHGPTDGPFGEYYAALGVPVVAISDYQRGSAPNVRWVATVHNAVDVEAYPFREQKDDFVLFMARMSLEKGAHVAPEVCRRAGYPLVLAGKCREPEEQRYFEQEIARWLNDDVRFVGEIAGEEKARYLSRARCLLVPPQWDEPFGLASIEALACGTPVVALRRGALGELVDHGRTGWLCDDASELEDGVRRAGEIDPHECRADAARRFSRRAMAEAYAGVYRSLVAG